MILQQYIKSPEPFITRVEVVGKQFVLAMRSSTSDGFELCPSDACQLGGQSNPDVCPAEGPASKFSTSPLTADDPLVAKYIAMCEGEGLDLAGIEFVEDADGNRYTYDINGHHQLQRCLRGAGRYRGDVGGRKLYPRLGRQRLGRHRASGLGGLNSCLRQLQNSSGPR